MISDVDRTIEELLKQEFGAALPFDLSFAVPDKDFRPISNTKNTLNCYLYDIREDRELRNSEPILKHNSDGTVEKSLPPARIKLLYCVTAWSPGQVTPGTAPVMDEHRLLSDVLIKLLRHPTIPEAVLQGRLVGQQPPLPTAVVLPDGAKNTSDFWNAIGGQLRPSLDYGMTISMDYQLPVTGRTATTIGIGYSGEGELITIGGTIYDSSVPPVPVADAWIRLEETGAIYSTDDEGRFRIGMLARESYTLNVRAVGFRPNGRVIQVPQPDGLYDLALIPL